MIGRESAPACWHTAGAYGAGPIIKIASANAYVSLPSGTLANTISPALIVTKHAKERLDHEPGFKETVLKAIMSGRSGTPENIGHDDVCRII